ncbi:MAG: arginine--tRNA ligase, partial [Gemmatimonadetes bacterium]|nr:arginine--tRNA ligase [Gemmatimonadota bacterium]
TDQRQALHFRQLFSALDRAGFDWADRNEHIPYGLVKIVDGGRILPMSTRSGKMIRLEELLDRLVAAVRTIVEEEAVKRAELSPPEIERVSEAVGVGAVLFWTQARGRRNDLLFDWDRATDTRGATGPYLQYAHARLCGILRKHGGPVPSARGVSPLESPEELAIARRLAEFPSVLHKAAELYEPSMLAEFLLDLSSSFSTFYNKHRVLKQEDSVTSARLRLVDAIRLVLARGLTILGMTAPERM